MVDLPSPGEAKPDVPEMTLSLSQEMLHVSAARLASELAGYLASAPPAPRINISLEAVDFVDSSVLSALIAFNTLVKARGGELRLSHITPQVYEVFLVSKLGKLFASCTMAPIPKPKAI